MGSRVGRAARRQSGPRAHQHHPLRPGRTVSRAPGFGAGQLRHGRTDARHRCGRTGTGEAGWSARQLPVRHHRRGGHRRRVDDGGTGRHRYACRRVELRDAGRLDRPADGLPPAVPLHRPDHAALTQHRRRVAAQRHLPRSRWLGHGQYTPALRGPHGGHAGRRRARGAAGRPWLGDGPRHTGHRRGGALWLAGRTNRRRSHAGGPTPPLAGDRSAHHDGGDG